MRLVVVDGHPGSDQRIEDGGGELGNATADVVNQHSLVDESAFHETLLFGAPAHMTIEREALARLDDDAAHEVGEAVDVRHSALAARMACRERPHQLDNAERLQICLLLAAHSGTRRQRHWLGEALQQCFGHDRRDLVAAARPTAVARDNRRDFVDDLHGCCGERRRRRSEEFFEVEADLSVVECDRGRCRLWVQCQPSSDHVEGQGMALVGVEDGQRVAVPRLGFVDGVLQFFGVAERLGLFEVCGDFDPRQRSGDALEHRVDDGIRVDGLTRPPQVDRQGVVDHHDGRRSGRDAELARACEHRASR